MISSLPLEVFIKIEVKDNNVDQALRILKRKLQREGFFKIIKIKSNYEKPSEKKKRLKQENIKRAKKIQKMRNRI
jgi:small subunit ribosomal protein S21